MNKTLRNIYIWIFIPGFIAASLSCGGSKFEVEDYRPVLRENPDAGGRYFNRGVALAILGRHEESAGAFEKAVRENPGDAEALFRLGKEYSLLKRFDDAAGAFRKSFQSGQIDALHEDVGAAYFLLNQFDKAAEEYRLSLKKDEPHPVRTMCNLGATYIRMKEYDKAIGLYERALKVNRQASVVYNACFNLAVAYHLCGRFNDALIMYEAAHADDPANPDIYYNRALVYIKLNEPDKAVEQAKILSKYDTEKSSVVIDEIRREWPDYVVDAVKFE